MKITNLFKIHFSFQKKKSPPQKFHTNLTLTPYDYQVVMKGKAKKSVWIKMAATN